MGSLLRHLSTARGADLVLICNQEIFLVHRAVISELSPVLKREACNSKALDGEVISLNEVSPGTLVKILAFMYSDHAPASCRKSLASSVSADLPPAQKFPASDRKLLPLWGNVTTVHPTDRSKVTTATVPSSEKWTKILQNQAALATPYNSLTCKDYKEVISEFDVYAAAKELEILALQKISMNRVLAWFEVELQAGRSPSNNFRAAASYILRKHEDFGKSFVRLCAKHVPVVETDSALVSIIEEKHSFAWDIAMSVRHQWTTEVHQHRMELEDSKDLLFDLQCRHSQQKVELEDFGKVLKSQVETLSRSLVLAEDRAEAATKALGQQENLVRALREDSLAEKASALQLKEANRASKEKKTNKSGNATQKLVTKIEELQRIVASKEKALEQSRAANQRIKDELRYENDGLRSENGKLKDVFNKVMRFINNEEDCRRCRRRWDIRLGHKKHISVSIGCKCCGYKEWYNGTD